MKIAASIFSWVGGALTTILAFILAIKGIPSYEQFCSYSGPNVYSCHYEIVFNASPVWLWVYVIIATLGRIAILIWRQYATSNGKKVACGVCTLIFASLIGGILTLCIPEEDLYF